MPWPQLMTSLELAQATSTVPKNMTGNLPGFGSGLSRSFAAAAVMTCACKPQLVQAVAMLQLQQTTDYIKGSNWFRCV